jgi:hypothetical protein
MIRPSIRISCAAVAVVLLAAGGFHAGVLPILAGVLFLIPATFGGGAATEDDIERLDVSRRLFRNASLVCFGAALALYAVVLSMGDRRGAIAQQAASLGAAFWLVAVILLFLFAFYASRRRALVRAR